MQQPRIVVVGSSNTDVAVKVDRLPKRGETVSDGHFLMNPGGKGANQAVAAARLGGRVTLVARVGQDVFGKDAAENFRKEGVETRFIVRDKEKPSGVALIIVGEEGQNLIAVAPGANRALSKQDVASARAEIEKSDVLLLQLEPPLDTVRYATALASRARTPVILNPAPARELGDDLLQEVTVLTPNETEAELLTGIRVRDEKSARRAAMDLRQRGASKVVVTLGDLGAFVASEEWTGLAPARNVQALDTTAAGDAFNGALAYALGSRQSFTDAVRLANLAGAFAATRFGAQSSLPTSVELRRMTEE